MWLLGYLSVALAFSRLSNFECSQTAIGLFKSGSPLRLLPSKIFGLKPLFESIGYTDEPAQRSQSDGRTRGSRTAVGQHQNVGLDSGLDRLSDFLGGLLGLGDYGLANGFDEPGQ